MLRAGRAAVTSPSPPVTSRLGSLTSLAAAVVARARGGRGRDPTGAPPGWERQFRDSFVPLSPRELRGALLREFHPSGQSRAAFLDFAARLDQSLHPRYHRLHLHLQALYGPIDPDQAWGDPSQASGGAGGPWGGARGARRARRMVAALAPLLAEANFQRVPEAAVAFALEVQHPQDEVQVTLRPEDYHEIQFWALGQRVGPLPPSSDPSPRRWPYPRPPPATPRRYFQHVVVLGRPRGGSPGGSPWPLELAAFRAVPLDALELLPGGGRVRPPGGARSHVALAAWGSLVFLNLGLGLMADLKVGATGLLLALGAVLSVRGAKALSRRRAAAALTLAHSRARRATAQHGQLVAALTRRAQDEATKEALLARTFLPRCGGPGAGVEARLQAEVEAWLWRRFGLPLAFPARRACERLRGLGAPPPAPQPPPEPPQPGGGTP